MKLEFTDDALEAIADKAMEKDTGARALRSIIEEFMLDIMYEIPKDDNIGRVTITGDYIRGTGGPLIDIRSNGYSLEERDQMKQIAAAETKRSLNFELHEENVRKLRVQRHTTGTYQQYCAYADIKNPQGTGGNFCVQRETDELSGKKFFLKII